MAITYFKNAISHFEDCLSSIGYNKEKVKKAINRAYYGIGNCYGEIKQEDQAIIWYTKAANGGNVASQFLLGNYYEYGWRGLEKDGNTALYLLLKNLNQRMKIHLIVILFFLCLMKD